MENILYKYGLDNFFTNSLSQVDTDNLGKVVAVHKKSFKVIKGDGSEVNAIAKGSFIHYKSKNMAELPKLGDFVVLDLVQEQNAFIKYILPRKNALQRKIVGDKNENQIIVANIDYAFITIPLDEQFNIRKLERIILAADDSKIEPVIIITKSDLSSNIPLALLEERFKNIQIIITAMQNIESIIPIKNLLKNNKVGAFIGSSGSGKSTLTNMLLNATTQKTLAVGNQDKGKHTTTHREMFLLNSGGCIVDNPGIKEFALWLENEESIDNSFADIKNLAENCKFRDCTHTNEPNCAVIKAIEDGILDLDKYHNFLKLKSEEEDTALAKLQQQRKENQKNISKHIKNIKKFGKYN
ncbi:MAG: ribosome small subunit-dependent GTPase A [Alphaproteobacteria bacterium]|jgi:ribosome biogenesis GTPase|nr:ribosome small subunit-dependent GTPase A [Alphaproteobacteria bacterium]